MSCCDDPHITWDAETCLNVCIFCGDAAEHALVGPDADFTGTQVVNQNSKQTAIRSKRGPAQHVLAGESSEHKTKRYTIQMHEFIGSLCSQMSTPNLTVRVCLLFDQSMRNGLTKFRWGGQAKAVSGACLAVALRENNNPDRLKEIALLLGQKYLYLQRTLATLLASLNIKLPSTTPSHHIPNLLSHLFQELKQRPEDSIFNVKLYSQLKDISLQAVAELSCAFLETFAMTSQSKFIESSPTSCAASAFVICLEGEFRKSLSEIKDLFKCFVQVCHLSADTLARPYRVMRQEVLKWMKDLNWAEEYKKTPTGRADSSQRDVCARGLKDALRGIDQLWRLEQRTMPGQQRLRITLDNDIDSGDESLDEDPRLRKTENLPAFTPKNKKVDACVLDGAAFLLHPFSHLPSGIAPPTKYHRVNWSSVPRAQGLPPVSPLKSGSRANARSESTSRSKVASVLSGKSPANSEGFHKALNYTAVQFPTDPRPCDYINYLLSSDEPLSVIRLSIHEKATRVSLQAAALGAVDVDAIPDDELLTNEEWLTLQRTEEEQEQLLEYWNNVPGLMVRMEKNAERAKKRKYEHLNKEEDQDTANEDGDDIEMKKLKLFDKYDLGMPDLGIDSTEEDSGEQFTGLGAMYMKTISRFFSGDVNPDEELD